VCGACEAQMGYFLDKIFPNLFGATIATIIGGLLVFFLNWLQNQFIKTKKKQEAGIYALFVLIQHINGLVGGETYLAQWRLKSNEEDYWFLMKPLLDFSMQPELHIEDLAWVLETKDRTILLQYIEARNWYLTVNGLMGFRKEIKARVDSHLERFMERARETAPKREFTVQELIEQLSEREEKELKQSADDLLRISQQVIQFQFKIIADLLNVLKGIWRKGIWNKIIWGRVKFIDIGTMDEILKTKELIFKDGKILPAKEEPISNSND
jgi:hypothetical protein